MFSIAVIVLAVLGVAQCQNSGVVFSVGLAHNVTYANNDTVLYDHVFSNVGAAYDAATGVFTCPSAGLYAFQFHSLSHLASSTWLELYHNLQYIASIFGHSNSDYAAGGNSCVLTLAQGDTVEIKAVDATLGYPVNLYGGPGDIYTTFSGYKL